MSIIEVTNLHRTFLKREPHLFHHATQKITAIRDLSFHVNSGEIFGLLGQNGAGKTTTIKTLTTLLLPTSGNARVLGLDVATSAVQIRPRINFIFGGEGGLYWRLTARDNLRYFGHLYRVPSSELETRVSNLLALVGLTSSANMRVETFSKGMKQKLQIARGLINNPRILFMDEPTIGLDALAVQNLHTIIQTARAQGTTILLTTQYLHQAEELCDRLLIIDHGEQVISGTVSNVIDQAAKRFPTKPIVNLEDAYIALIKEEANV